MYPVLWTHKKTVCEAMQGIFCMIVERGENVSKQKLDSERIEELRNNPNVKRVTNYR